MKKKEKPSDEMEDVELESTSFFRIFDSSMPLIIDTATKNTHSKIFVSVIIFAFAMVGLSICSPKTHYTKSVDIPFHLIYNQSFHSIIESTGLYLDNKTVTVYLNLVRMTHHNFTHSRLNKPISYKERMSRHMKNHHHYHNFTKRFYFDIDMTIHFLSKQKELKSEVISLNHSQFFFSHHNVHSDSFVLFSLPTDSADKISIDFDIYGNLKYFQGLHFCFCVENSMCPVFCWYASLFFGMLAVAYFMILLLTCQRRFEQIGTLIFFFLFILSNLSLVFHGTFWNIIKKVMDGYLQLYMFYLISFVANKHRTIITHLSFALIFITLFSDIVYCLKRLDPSFNFFKGHHIFWHAITLSVTESMIAAMYDSIDDFPAFFVYTASLTMSFFTCLISDDLAVFFPNMHHYINIDIFFVAMHTIILNLLFLYHRSSTVRTHDQTSNSMSRTDKL
ncbi:hypothetical protein TRFO_20462 [Tritrichomonas foetus]|uniref:Uncharacterized protein n=1 Tax=Tritrichomonas foetus TaxID=1144522 RepID=A0A1J4KLR8_9EUKA|nr:hypothetical protein TRFO_20462 [Tritrichomonas foetus]|eukprot:OHT10325.1 hypothetical protein TRFO_20462 [Tritrichomonas foetus]